MKNDNRDVYLSVVSPVYKAELIVDELVRRIISSVSSITDNFEIILVEDGGPDNSWQKIEENCSKNDKVKGIKLSRNFGQHHAITAGLDSCRGEWVVVMDCDLQDQPEEIINLYNTAQKGFDIVFASRFNRQDTLYKRATSKTFSLAFSYLSGIDHDGTIANFGIYNGKVIQSVCSLREPMRAFLPMIKWVGFKSTAIQVEHSSRYEGKSSYNWPKLIGLALDISLAYSDKPLRMIVKIGFAISFLSILAAFYFLVVYLLGDVKVAGFTSIIICICFLSGLMMFMMGIIGLYISKVFDSVKHRPLYLTANKVNF